MSSLLYPSSNLKVAEEIGGIHFTRGKGVYVYDDKGKEYIEGMAGLWCTSLGYGNEELAETAAEQIRNFSFGHMFAAKRHDPGLQLADKLADMVPVENARIFFGASGSDANDTHIKVLRYYFNAIGKPEKKKIIARERGYHGVTLGAACLTGLPPMHAHFDLPLDALGILRTDAPHYYRGARDGETEIQFVDRIVDNLEQLILREGPETIAAMIAEPVLGAGGVVVAPDTYYEKVQAVLSKYDILLIADEVITGFGRTGNVLGSDTYNIKPQMMSFAKQLSSGYQPISAAVIPGFMHDAMVQPSNEVGIFGHGYTYSGHPVPAAVALKTLEIYERDGIYAKAAQTGIYFQKKLAELLDHPLVGEVRGAGLLGAVELVADKATKAVIAGGKGGAFCMQAAEKHGVITRAVAGNSLAFCPPLVITEAELEEMFVRFGKALDDTLEYCQKEGLLS